MTCDSAEIVRLWEHAFRLTIPDDDAARLVSVRTAASYIASRVAIRRAESCLRQSVFFRVRRVVWRVPGSGKVLLRSRLASLVPRRRDWIAAWREVAHDATCWWPRKPPFTTWLSYHRMTVADVVHRVALTMWRNGRRPATEWTREEITMQVRWSVFVVTGAVCYGDDERFVEDLRIE